MYFLKSNKDGVKPEVVEIADKDIHAQVYYVLTTCGLWQKGDSASENAKDRIYLREQRLKSEAMENQIRTAIIGWAIKGILGMLALGFAAWVGNKL